MADTQKKQHLFFAIHSCVWSGLSKLQTPKMPNRLDRTVQFRQGSVDWHTCAFTRFPNEPVDGEHLLKGNRKRNNIIHLLFGFFFHVVVVVVVALFHEHVVRQLSDAQISYLRRKSKSSLLSPTTRLHESLVFINGFSRSRNAHATSKLRVRNRVEICRSTPPPSRFLPHS